jgi:hypothetical protein
MTRRAFGLLLVGSLLSTPAMGQSPWQPPRTPDGQPDLQGIWHNDTWLAILPAISLEGFEGEHAYILEAENRIASLPAPKSGRSLIIDPADGKIPYLPWAVKERQAFIAHTRTPTELAHVDPNSRSWPQGVPRVNGYEQLQIVQTPGYVVFLYAFAHQYRVVPLDSRPHVGSTIKLFNGDARGRWEGNTLVVDTTNLTDRTRLDHVSFHGVGLHVVERWTRVAPDRIEFSATLDDSTMFSRPWTIAYSFLPEQAGFELWEEAAYEGERSVTPTLEGNRKQQGK